MRDKCICCDELAVSSEGTQSSSAFYCADHVPEYR